MFTPQDNEDLTRVGPGTLMGDLMRRYWVPFLLPEELPEPDCPPIRVRLMAEDLVAFRDSTGRIGLLDRFCPHRRVDLFFARNEECGLRCVYHGWKFDAHGNCLDMPAEPGNSPMRSEVKIKAYPTIEWGGVVWAYLGPPEHRPAKPPELEWGLVSSGQRHVCKRLQQNNYAQGVEGGIDSSHVSILHSMMDPEKAHLPWKDRLKGIANRYLSADTAPKFYVRPTPYGMRIGARRVASENEYYWRITQFLLPFYTMVARRSDDAPILGHAWVPIDDHNTWTFTMWWNPARPDLGVKGVDFDIGDVNVPVKTDGSYQPVHNRTNNYGIDRQVQRLLSSTGIQGIGLQDSAIQETMGPIVDRSRETLGSSDTAIVQFRRMVLAQARQLRQTGEVSLPKQPELYRVRSAAVVLPREVDFEAGAGPRLVAA